MLMQREHGQPYAGGSPGECSQTLPPQSMHAREQQCRPQPAPGSLACCSQDGTLCGMHALTRLADHSAHSGGRRLKRNVHGARHQPQPLPAQRVRQQLRVTVACGRRKRRQM